MRATNKTPQLFIGLVLLLAACGSAEIQPTATTTELPPSPALPAVNEDRSGCVITAPPPELDADPFYEKYCDANGIPILASGPVSDVAVRQAYYLVVNYFAPIPDFLDIMIANGGRLAIYGRKQTVRDVPETYTFSLSNSPDVAGLGGSLSQPVTVTHESDLSGRWHPCNRVTVHELSHALRDIVLLTNVRGFLSAQNDAFANAVREGLWQGSYAGTNSDENWAEGVNAYFGVERYFVGGSYISNRADLAEYDPKLYDLIDSIFRGFEWTPSCP